MRLCSDCLQPATEVHAIKCTTCKNGRYTPAGLWFIVTPVVGRSVGAIFVYAVAAAYADKFFKTLGEFSLFVGLLVLIAVSTGLWAGIKRAVAVWNTKKLLSQAHGDPDVVVAALPPGTATLFCSRCGREGHVRETCTDLAS